MIRYTLRRLIWGVLVILVVITATFVLFGPVLQSSGKIDAAARVCGPHCSPPEVDRTRNFLGLNKPWYTQYGIYLRRVVLGPDKAELRRLCSEDDIKSGACAQRDGRLGTTFLQSRAVDKVITQALPTTISLTLSAAFVWILLSVPIGILSALKTRSFFDRATMVGVLWGQSLPVYYFGLLSLYLLAYLPNSDTFINWFGFRVNIFPIGGYVGLDWGNPWPWLHHLILPGATLALQFAALYVRMIRSNMLGTMSEDYIRTARAKGAPEHRVVLRHGLRNALLPIVTMFGMDIGILLGGAILTEFTFGLPGVGQLVVTSAESLDVPLVAGVVLFGALAIVMFNLAVDLLYAVLDPRIRLT